MTNQTAARQWVQGFTTLETPRLVARPVRADDDRLLYAALDNPRVHRLIAGFPQPFDLSSVRRWLAERLARMERGDGMYGLVFYKDSETLVGYFGMMVADDGAAEIAGAIDELYWGKGFAEEFGFGLVSDLFAAGAPSIIATTALDNVASMRVLQVMNFQQEGQKDITTASGTRSSWLFRLTPEAWKSAKVVPLNDGASREDVQARRHALIKICQDLKARRVRD